MAAVGADVDLRAASDMVRRVVAAAPHSDADADELRSRLAGADTAATALVSDASAALDDARLAVSDARSGTPPSSRPDCEPSATWTTRSSPPAPWIAGQVSDVLRTATRTRDRPAGHSRRTRRRR